MTDPELERLASLWRQPDPAEQAMFEKVARRARLQARLLGYADVLLFLFILIVMSIVVFRHGTATTAVSGLVLTAFIAWGTRQRRIYRETAQAIDTSRRETFLDSAIEGARARHRIVLLSFQIFVPFFLLTSIFLISAERGVDLDGVLFHAPEWLLSWPGLRVIPLFGAALAWSLLLHYRIKAEIGRLEKLKRAYEAEGRLDAPIGAGEAEPEAPQGGDGR